MSGPGTPRAPVGYRRFAMRRTIVMCLSGCSRPWACRRQSRERRGLGRRWQAVRPPSPQRSGWHARTPWRRPPDVSANHRRFAAPDIGYRSLVPFVRGYGPADYALNRLVARRSLEWLGRASVLYGRDPVGGAGVPEQLRVDRRLLSRLRAVLQPGAFVAYAGATRLAQRMVLNGYDTDR